MNPILHRSNGNTYLHAIDPMVTNNMYPIMLSMHPGYLYPGVLSFLFLSSSNKRMNCKISPYRWDEIECVWWTSRTSHSLHTPTSTSTKLLSSHISNWYPLNPVTCPPNTHNLHHYILIWDKPINCSIDKFGTWMNLSMIRETSHNVIEAICPNGRWKSFTLPLLDTIWTEGKYGDVYYETTFTKMWTQLM